MTTTHQPPASPAGGSFSPVPAPYTVSAEHVETIYRSLKALHPEPNPVLEIRALDVPKSPGNPWTEKYAGYFTDLREAAKTVARLDAKGAKGVYTTINELNPAVVSRTGANRLKKVRDEATTRDHDVIRRKWLYFDLDPVRPADVSSSEEELAAAWDAAERLRTWLIDNALPPSPLVAESGNGVHLLFPCDLPNDKQAETTVKTLLQVAAAWLDGNCDKSLPRINVDQAVYNAARICRVWGTTARKGANDQASGRIWRQGWLKG